MSTLLQVKNISKAFGPHVILEGASFTVSDKQKIGVIGRNGAGKSTLFKIIIGLDKEDEGEIMLFDNTHIGYLKQEDDFEENDTVISYLVRKSKKKEWQCAKIAAQFELKNDFLTTKIKDLSGGYQMRVKLSLMLLHEPNLLLLDEPTNYLDLSTMLLLEDFLKKYNGSYLIISHDRRFIKNTCEETLEIERGQAYHYNGNLEAYLKFKKEKQIFAEKFNKKQDSKKKHLQKFVDRFGAKASLAAQAKSKEKQIARLQSINIDATLSDVFIKIPPTVNKKGLGLRLTNLAIGYGNKKIAKDINIDVMRGEHLAVLGDNGQGKSTFLKTIAEKLPLLDGNLRWAKHIKIAYYAQHITSELNPQETIESFLERSAGPNNTIEEIYKMAGDFLFTEEDIKKPISVLSGGEKARLCLAGILLHENDVLLFDEPTNHLDFETAEALGFALAQSNVTVFFISHDRTFTSILADNILEVSNGIIKKFHGNYDDYIYSLKKKSGLKVEEKAKEDGVNLEISPLEYPNEKARRIQKHEELKKLKKDITRLEKKVEKLKDEKESILAKFASDPTNPSQELNNRLKELTEEIPELEEQWFETNEKIYNEFQ